MEKQTAVEWLENKFIENGVYLSPIYTEAFKQAIEMEKEQIMKAVYDSMGTNFDPNMGRAEQYYNEKYK